MDDYEYDYYEQDAGNDFVAGAPPVVTESEEQRPNIPPGVAMEESFLGAQLYNGELKRRLNEIMESVDISKLLITLASAILWVKTPQLFVTDRLTSMLVFLMYFYVIDRERAMEWALLTTVATSFYDTTADEKPVLRLLGALALVIAFMKFVPEIAENWYVALNVVSFIAVIYYAHQVRQLRNMPEVSGRVPPLKT